MTARFVFVDEDGKEIVSMYQHIDVEKIKEHLKLKGFKLEEMQYLEEKL